MVNLFHTFDEAYHITHTEVEKDLVEVLLRNLLLKPANILNTAML